METSKAENYEREYGKGSFPVFWRLEAQQLQEVRRRLASALGIAGTSLGHEICQAVQERSKPVEGVNAEDEDFNLRQLLNQLGLLANNEVYLNWYQYDDVDVMHTSDLLAHFSDIWYPSSDDLDLLAPSLSWVLSISHYGAIRVLRIEEEFGERHT